MKETPIIFTTENIKAILDNRKTQTRRVIKFKTEDAHRIYKYVYPCHQGGFSFQDFPSPTGVVDAYDETGKLCPYGQAGDRLWVRETWGQAINISQGDTGTIYYKATNETNWQGKWRPSIFMPRWASRLTLENIADPFPQRLQEITEDDFLREGGWKCCEGIRGEGTMAYGFGEGDKIIRGEYSLDYKDEFKKLWDSLNARRGFPWSGNWWVWVIPYRRIEC